MLARRCRGRPARPRRSDRHPRCRGSGGAADPPAAAVQPQGGVRIEAARSQPGGPAGQPDAAAPHRREHPGGDGAGPGFAGGQGRPGAAGADVAEPGAQRPGRHGGRRHAADHDQPGGHLGRGPAAGSRSQGRALRATAGGGRRDGDDGRGPGPSVRAVLHNQGAGQRDRSGPGDGVRDRRGQRRFPLGLDRARRRHRGRGVPAGNRRRGPGPRGHGAPRGARTARPGDCAAGGGRGRCAPRGRAHPGRTRLPRADRQQRRSGAGAADVHHRAHRPLDHRRGDARDQRACAGRERPAADPRLSRPVRQRLQRT